MGTETKVESLPLCDLCKEIGEENEAHYDGMTVFGYWANMCDDCFAAVGTGLGIGVGQRLVLQEQVG